MIIYKYPLSLRNLQSVEMPHNAKVLSVQNQRGVITLWALIEDEVALKGSRTFEIEGTGQEMIEIREFEKRIYVGTVQTGELVWHVFEITYASRKEN